MNHLGLILGTKIGVRIIKTEQDIISIMPMIEKVTQLSDNVTLNQ
jgi:hypothetical protein